MQKPLTPTFRRLAALTLGLAFALPLGFAAAQDGASGSEQTSTGAETFRQNVDIPRENVLAALALGEDDLDDVANIERSWTASRSIARSLDLDEDTVFLALALEEEEDLIDLLLLDRSIDGGRITRSDLDLIEELDDWDGRDEFDDLDSLDDALDIADLDDSRTVSRTLRQQVNIDQDDVLFALALGVDDLSDIADIERSETGTATQERDVDLDEEDVLLRRALDRN